MAKQNIYDNTVFFEGHKQIRENEGNANDLIEKPALFSMMPDLNGKTVLDMGCGYGENSKEFIGLGAKRVVGIDISEKMLKIAKEQNAGPGIEYQHMCMEDVDKLDEKFDVVCSSLAMHYVKEFKEVVRKVYELLNDNGVFLFSQENPLNTCFSRGNRWTYDASGNAVYTNVYNYSVDGERVTAWLVDDVVKYHRTFSSIINTLVEQGFIIEQLEEPILSKEEMGRFPRYKKDVHKPDFLLVKVKKPQAL